MPHVRCSLSVTVTVGPSRHWTLCARLEDPRRKGERKDDHAVGGGGLMVPLRVALARSLRRVEEGVGDDDGGGLDGALSVG
jgi:hypothetical protein